MKVMKMKNIRRVKFFALAAGCVAAAASAFAFAGQASAGPCSVEKPVTICLEPGRYVGWPTICRRANGELLVVFSGDRDAHVCPWGKVQMIRSSDGGRTWSQPAVLQNGPLDDRDAGIVELADGTLLLNWFTSVAFAEYDDPSLKKYKEHFASLPAETVRRELGYWTARSTDGGRTWEPKVRCPAQLPHGVTVLKDGRLLYVGKHYWHKTFKGVLPTDENRDALLCVESTDGGRSWRTLTEIRVPEGMSVHGFNEPHLAELPDGRLVCQVRYERDNDPWTGSVQTESADGGRTWTPIHGALGGYPPHLLTLSDGRLLSVYCKRFGRGDGQNGEYACYSEDGGRTWRKDREVLLATCPDYDHGYPATVELPGGELLTVFYGKEKADDTVTCLRLVRWRADWRSALDRFYSESAGKTVRRLPVDVLPENTFHGYGNGNFEESDDRTMTFGARADFEQGTWNMATLTLRSKPDLSDAITQERVKGYIERAHALGVKVFMDTDPRIARHEFLRRWPEDAQWEVRFEMAAADADGKAACTVRFPSHNDHMSAGSTRPYEATDGRLTGVWAYRADAKGKVDPKSVRDAFPRTTCETLEAEAGKPRRLVVRAEGLQAGERLCVQAEFRLYSADVFSPHLLPYTRELMERYKALGADGGMRDEWGFPPSAGEDFRRHRSFWTSRHYAAAYAKRTKGRKLGDDFLLFALDIAGRETERQAAIAAYMRLNYERNAAIERHFYENDKELFGRDVYVCKHPTWYPKVSWEEFMHNGLDWWAAPRDWAQSDEAAPVPAICGMTKKFGGANWLNEGYQSDSLFYAPIVWRYALAGGRMVFHPVFPANERFRAKYRGPGHTKMEYWAAKHTDILKDGALDAQCRIRLANLVSDAPIDCPAAVIFGHARVVNWADPAYLDWARRTAYGIWMKGYGTDVYPSSELEGTTFAAGADGRLAVGRQRYDAVVCAHFSKEDAAAFARVVGNRALRTRVFTMDAPGVAGATEIRDLAGAEVAEALAKANAVRQTPIWTGTLPEEHGWDAVLPKPDGILRLTDGTQVRMKALKSVAGGDPIDGELEFDGGKKVSFAAEGVFAARLGADGSLEAVAGGALRRVSGPGFSCALEKPEDVALVRRADGWHGVWQTKDASGGVPPALKRLAAKWTVLLRP